jgi:hypothetical protein
MTSLVIVMAGDGSLHEAYASDRDFELWVCHWGADEEVARRFGRSCDRLFRAKGQKWALARAVGRMAREQGLPPFSSYDYVFLPDDDIAFAGGAADISAAFQLAGEIGADIFQPAVANENFSPGWEATRRVPGVVCRASTLAEIMMPGYSGTVFERCLLPLLHVQGHMAAGWGLEPLVARFAEAIQDRPTRTFVLDETPAIHTRPVGTGTASYALARDEAFLNPFGVGVSMKELERFRSRSDAARFAFPAADAITDWRRIDKFMTRARGARRLYELTRRKTLGSFILKGLQSLAARGSAPGSNLLQREMPGSSSGNEAHE